MHQPLLLLSLAAICLTQLASADPSANTNGTDWKDTEGNPIVAHEGELSRFNGVFYRYGSLLRPLPPEDRVTNSEDHHE